MDAGLGRWRGTGSNPVGKVHRFPFKGMGLPTACRSSLCNSPPWHLSLKGTGWKKDELPQHGLPREGRCWVGEWYS